MNIFNQYLEAEKQILQLLDNRTISIKDIRENPEKYHEYYVYARDNYKEKILPATEDVIHVDKLDFYVNHNTKSLWRKCFPHNMRNARIWNKYFLITMSYPNDIISIYINIEHGEIFLVEHDITS